MDEIELDRKKKRSSFLLSTLPNWLLCCCFLILPWNIHANHDTLYICSPGASIELQVDTSFEGYRWWPSNDLSNPTIANPTARPTVTTTYIVEAIGSSGPNLIINGDFSNGNQGFSSDYTYSPGANPTQGVYGIFPDANNLSPQYFAHCRDHTTGQGNLMAVDGSPQANEQVWCQSIQIAPNTTYGFSTWITSILPSNPARLQFSINGLSLAQPFNAGNTVCEWRQFYTTWTSGQATDAEICIVNQNTNPNGNDFALDDFSFFQLGQVLYDTFTVVVEDIGITQIDTTICAGSVIEYDGTLVPADTSIQFRYNSIHGCDSLVRLNVGVLDTIYKYILVDTLCPGEILDFFGHTIVSDTVICETFPISSSCDSTYCLTAVFLTETALEIEIVEPSCADSQDGSLLVNPRAGLPPYTYQWNTGVMESAMQNLRSDTYTVSVTDSKGCTAQKQIQLREPPPLQPQTTARSKLCNGEINGILMFNATGGTPSYEYSIDNGLFFQSETSRQNLSLGNYTVLIRDVNGCKATQNIPIPEPATIELYPPDPTTISLGTVMPVLIQTNTNEPLTYEWSPDTGVACPTCPDTEVQPLGHTTYTITATDRDGCRWSVDWPIKVTKEPDVYVPNAFSPNGDGQNDFFALYTGPSIARIQNLQIFDRWGNLLFISNNCLSQEEACRWDGRNGGQIAGEGVYIYFATIEYIDGETAVFSGDIALVR